MEFCVENVHKNEKDCVPLLNGNTTFSISVTSSSIIKFIFGKQRNFDKIWATGLNIGEREVLFTLQSNVMWYQKENLNEWKFCCC